MTTTYTPDHQDNEFLIGDHYLVGDLHTAALVYGSTSIDWLCTPTFDSPSLFGKLLDDQTAGSCWFDFDEEVTIKHSYEKDTAVVTFDVYLQKKNKQKILTITDFMLPQPTEACSTHYYVRQIKSYDQPVSCSLNARPRPNYGQKATAVSNDNTITAQDENLNEVLNIHVPAEASITIKENQSMISCQLKIEANTETSVLLTFPGKNKTKKKSPSFSVEDHSKLYEKTISFWKDWVAQGEYYDWCRDELVRSAVTLKLLQYYPTGGLIAAPTTSLPEEIGGQRNWDYRYVWIRDATFSLFSLSSLGHHQEAERFFDFISQIYTKAEQNALDQKSDLEHDIQLMYTIDGESTPNEQDHPTWKGYLDSPPVRIGNGAHDQFQLDVFGTLLDAIYFATKHSIEHRKVRKKLVLRLVSSIKRRWQDPDNGIWEVREREKQFTYSKVMCWVGINRALRMADDLEFTDEEIASCESLEKEIESWIWQNCFDEEEQKFRQFPETEAQDATNFLFVMLQFLDKESPLTEAIIKNTEAELVKKDIFAYRYLNPDGLEGEEGAFILCSYWMSAAWAMLGDVKKARHIFDSIASFKKVTGLLAEEIDPDSKQFLGNYPQAFSHMGLIMAAKYIDRYSKRNDR